jgi:hypothetical protein
MFSNRESFKLLNNSVNKKKWNRRENSHRRFFFFQLKIYWVIELKNMFLAKLKDMSDLYYLYRSTALDNFDMSKQTMNEKYFA